MSVQARVNNTNLPLCLKNGKTRDNFTIKQYATGVLLKGQIMGKEMVIIGTVTADGGNTGNGTVDQYALASGGPAQIGSYNLECIVATTNGGTFKLEGPGGELISNNLVMTAGAGASTTFEIAGLTFRITDGGTDFVVGDKFALTTTAGSKLIPVTDAESLNGSNLPLYILGEEVDATGGDIAGITAYIEGDFDAQQLALEDTATLATDITVGDVSKTIREWLQDVGIVAIDSTYIDGFENT